MVSTKQLLKRQARKFCSNTGLHGYKYLVLPDQTLLERALWMGLIGTSMIAALQLSRVALENINKNVIYTITDSTHHPIWNYEFPAVTVCSFNQISKEKVYNFVKFLNRSSTITQKQMIEITRSIIELLPTSNLNVPQRNLSQLQDVLDQNNILAYQALELLTPNCSEIMRKCKWKSSQKLCEDLFERIVTPLGFCCSFNYFAGKYSNFSRYLLNKKSERPRRVTACGYKTSLRALVENIVEDYFATDVTSYGHKILIHHPYDHPDWNVPNMWLQFKNTMFISVTPTLVKAGFDEKSLSVKQRNCLFLREDNLMSFKYTYRNCMLNCRRQFFLRHCDCVPFYYYYHVNDKPNTEKICDLRDNICISKYKQINFDSQLTTRGSDNVARCDCLPDCEYCHYQIESSQGEFSRTHAKTERDFYGDLKIANQSVFRVFFNDLIGVRNTRVLTQQWHTLFAFLGGILSLFTGFTFGTAFEVFYFFVIKIIAIKLSLKSNKITNKDKQFY